MEQKDLETTETVKKKRLRTIDTQTYTYHEFQTYDEFINVKESLQKSHGVRFFAARATSDVFKQDLEQFIQLNGNKLMELQRLRYESNLSLGTKFGSPFIMLKEISLTCEFGAKKLRSDGASRRTKAVNCSAQLIARRVLIFRKFKKDDKRSRDNATVKFLLKKWDEQGRSVAMLKELLGVESLIVCWLPKEEAHDVPHPMKEQGFVPVHPQIISYIRQMTEQGITRGSQMQKCLEHYVKHRYPEAMLPENRGKSPYNPDIKKIRSIMNAWIVKKNLLRNPRCHLSTKPLKVEDGSAVTATGEVWLEEIGGFQTDFDNTEPPPVVYDHVATEEVICTTDDLVEQTVVIDGCSEVFHPESEEQIIIVDGCSDVLDSEHSVHFECFDEHPVHNGQNLLVSSGYPVKDERLFHVFPAATSIKSCDGCIEDGGSVTVCREETNEQHSSFGVQIYTVLSNEQTESEQPFSSSDKCSGDFERSVYGSEQPVEPVVDSEVAVFEQESIVCDNEQSSGKLDVCSKVNQRLLNEQSKNLRKLVAQASSVHSERSTDQQTVACDMKVETNIASLEMFSDDKQWPKIVKKRCKSPSIYGERSVAFWANSPSFTPGVGVAQSAESVNGVIRKQQEELRSIRDSEQSSKQVVKKRCKSPSFLGERSIEFWAKSPSVTPGIGVDQRAESVNGVIKKQPEELRSICNSEQSSKQVKKRCNFPSFLGERSVEFCANNPSVTPGTGVDQNAQSVNGVVKKQQEDLRSYSIRNDRGCKRTYKRSVGKKGVLPKTNGILPSSGLSIAKGKECMTFTEINKTIGTSEGCCGLLQVDGATPSDLSMTENQALVRLSFVKKSSQSESSELTGTAPAEYDRICRHEISSSSSDRLATCEGVEIESEERIRSDIQTLAEKVIEMSRCLTDIATLRLVENDLSKVVKIVDLAANKNKPRNT